jgi:radical SAM superfamily enzyme
VVKPNLQGTVSLAATTLVARVDAMPPAIVSVRVATADAAHPLSIDPMWAYAKCVIYVI